MEKIELKDFPHVFKKGVWVVADVVLKLYVFTLTRYQTYFIYCNRWDMSNPPKSPSSRSKTRSRSKTYQVFLEQICALHEPLMNDCESTPSSTLKRKASSDLEDMPPILKPFNFSSPSSSVTCF